MSSSTRAQRSRGALSNASGRFEAQARVAIDDGWGSAEGEPQTRVTRVGYDTSRSIITRNISPDLGFDRSINPYRGCEHGCVYCYARPTHAYLGLSPGLDFESRIFAKPDAPALLRAELARPAYRAAVIAIGTNTDPYQPVERRERITRAILEVLAEHDHPVAITTKGAGVLRDLDILAPMAAKGLASVAVSVTTLDRDLARRLEPRAAPPASRLGAIERLAGAGVPVAVMVAPIIPALTDHELEAILEGAARRGARSAGYIVLRLPREVRDLFEEWLRAHMPDRAEHVLGRLRAMRGGRLNDAAFGARMRGSGPFADLLAQRFSVACARLALNGSLPKLDTSQFRAPRRNERAEGAEGAENMRQLSLF